MKNNESFADVYVGYPVDGTFTYAVPGDINVRPGMRVVVDFKNRKTTAYVHAVHAQRPPLLEQITIKPIGSLIDHEPIFDDRLVSLARKIADSYLSSVGEVFAMALPGAKSMNSRIKKRSAIPGDGSPIVLSSEQQTVYDEVLAAMPKKRLHCIFGITGSGKTEVYIRLAQHVLSLNQSAIYLVPEISLSSQLYQRLYKIFGEELEVYHSGLSPNQRLAAWNRFYRGESRIVVGTRSAVFMQCPSLGLIIIDEEHDGSYKENSTPRYNARRIAIMRSNDEQVLLISGSATPSLETLYAADKGIFKLHHLNQRYAGAQLPRIEIVEINPHKPSDMLSSQLVLHTRREIKNGNQAIFLLNRRGFSPLMLCGECGKTIECPHCSISLCYHNNDLLKCHYCGYIVKVTKTCPHCAGTDMIKVGSGTQRIEEVLEKTLKGARVFRLDQDSARNRDAAFELIDTMNAGNIDILLGTQMVAKGFDFHRVTIVGILLADIGLNLPDFRAGERIFSLLMQVAGRSGRGEAPGMVIVQTLNENNHMFSYLINHDYRGFYRHELSIRKLFGYPPFTRIARLLLRGRDEARVAGAAKRLRSMLDSVIRQKNLDVQVLGPSEAPFRKIGDNYRHHILLKSNSIEFIRSAISAVKDSMNSAQTYMEIDIDPYDIL